MAEPLRASSAVWQGPTRRPVLRASSSGSTLNRGAVALLQGQREQHVGALTTNASSGAGRQWRAQQTAGAGSMQCAAPPSTVLHSATWHTIAQHSTAQHARIQRAQLHFQALATICNHLPTGRCQPPALFVGLHLCVAGSDRGNGGMIAQGKARRAQEGMLAEALPRRRSCRPRTRFVSAVVAEAPPHKDGGDAKEERNNADNRPEPPVAHQLQAGAQRGVCAGPARVQKRSQGCSRLAVQLGRRGQGTCARQLVLTSEETPTLRALSESCCVTSCPLRVGPRG